MNLVDLTSNAKSTKHRRANTLSENILVDILNLPTLRDFTDKISQIVCTEKKRVSETLQKKAEIKNKILQIFSTESGETSISTDFSSKNMEKIQKPKFII